MSIFLQQYGKVILSIIGVTFFLIIFVDVLLDDDGILIEISGDIKQENIIETDNGGLTDMQGTAKDVVAEPYKFEPNQDKSNSDSYVVTSEKVKVSDLLKLSDTNLPEDLSMIVTEYSTDLTGTGLVPIDGSPIDANKVYMTSDFVLDVSNPLNAEKEMLLNAPIMGYYKFNRFGAIDYKNDDTSDYNFSLTNQPIYQVKYSDAEVVLRKNGVSISGASIGDTEIPVSSGSAGTMTKVHVKFMAVTTKGERNELETFFVLLN